MAISTDVCRECDKPVLLGTDLCGQHFVEWIKAVGKQASDSAKAFRKAWDGIGQSKKRGG